ncbi:MAG: superoxide dismutase family protein [Acidobacteria bacterium]|nr:superoxide dismutase family protein [Acidobacteriota bacterium]
MRNTLYVLAASFMCAAVAAAQSHNAVAVLKPTQGNNVKGTVRFDEKNGKTRIVANVTGLQPGKHGLHVHEKGDCSAPDATSAGGHFNPENKPHGAPDAAEHHVGDLGNLEADAKGKSRLNLTVDFLTVGDGPHSITGKAVIVHAQPDDLQSQPVGNAGARLACGVIERKK